MPRLFNLQGSDAKYIRYLECQVLETQRLLGPSCSAASGAFAPRALVDQRGSIHFIIWQPPGETSSQYRERSQVPRWRKKLDSFILSLPRRDGWEAARREAGLHTVEQNQLAIRLMLGETFARGVEASGLPITDVLSIRLTDDRELVVRGWTVDVGLRGKEQPHPPRGEFLKTIFTSYCAVLLHVGNAKDMVYAIMERYLGRIYDAKTLDYYRSGSLWREPGF